MSGNDIRDEEGNPIVLTDEHGNPVVLRDQNGNRIRIIGTAIRISAVDVDLIGERKHVPGTGLLSSTTGILSSTTTEAPKQHEAAQEQRVGEHDVRRPEGVLQRTASSSSSTSSEDDGQGGRVKKKKGLTQKLKEKLTIGKHKDEHPEHATTPTTTAATADPAVTGEHEKKGMMEKIREKLPMHHNHHAH